MGDSAGVNNGRTTTQSTAQEYDVIIIGAGISGINAAYRVQTQAPKGTNYAILEGRSDLGGTWDLFKYPGIRSDSDLYTFGFPWRPWNSGPAIADAPSILKYMKDAARESGIDKHIKYNHKVISADWNTRDLVWELRFDVESEEVEIRAHFIIFGTGYYDYETPLKTTISGINSFKGQVIHPQFWPEKLDYSNKRVVIIGSGATAVTMLPIIAKTAKRTTIVQRSPGYVFSLPNNVSMFTRFLNWVSPTMASKITRLRFLIVGYTFFYFCRMFPGTARSALRIATTKQLPASIPHDPHFNPSYNPWEQRLCMTPNGEFYQSMREGSASIVTGSIKTVTNRGISMESGEEVLADIIITATGLKLRFAGGIRLTIDQQPYAIPSNYMWKGVMLQDLPNTALVLGYTNASWTLGADATAQTVTRLLNEMKRKGAKAVVPRLHADHTMKEKPVLNLNSTYITKALDILPKSGDTGPWRPRSNYFVDIAEAKWGNIQTGLEYVVEGSKSLHAKY